MPEGVFKVTPGSKRSIMFEIVTREIRNTKLIRLEILVQAIGTVHYNHRLSLFFSLSSMSIAFDPLWGNS